ncbi:MAG: hypothetical protein RLZZ624_507 [Cyanobacteriota bacterium]|jgi:type IV pilus assembly protein PilC
MATYLASYTSSRGQPRQLQIEAGSPEQARRQLRRRGIRPTALVAQTAAATARTNPAPSGLKAWLEQGPSVREKAILFNKLAALVDSGIPIVRGLDLLARQQKAGLFQRALQAVSRDVNEGSSLGAAMRQWPKVFDRLSLAMIEAGEAGGVLDDTLKRLAMLLETNARLRNQIRSALGYPITVLVIAISVFLGMTIFLIPTFAGVFKDLGTELPPFTLMMVNLSAFLRSSFSLFVVMILLLLLLVFRRHYATATGRRQVDALVLSLPLFGNLITKTATAQFCRTLSSLSRAGVPILISLEIVREAAGNAMISAAIVSARQDVLEGVPISVALASKGVFPDMATSMLEIGEESGELDVMLSKVADFYEDEVSATVKALTSMLEPAMIVIVGGIVGSILLSMYLPMFSIFDQIK